MGTILVLYTPLDCFLGHVNSISSTYGEDGENEEAMKAN